MSVRRAAVAATFLIGSALPLLAATAASAAPTAGGSLCAPPADTVGPVVTQVTFGHPSIDLDGSRTQTVSVTASDTSGNGAPSGVARVSMFVRGNRFGADPKLTLTEGTSVSGEWTGQFVISKYAHPGPATIDQLEATDADRNEQTYTGYGTTPDGPNALSLHPADDPTFTVTGTPAKRPVKHPGAIKSFTFSPASVNTTASAKQVHVVASFTGPAPVRVFATFYNDKRQKRGRPAFVHVTLHSQGGKWVGSTRISRWLGDQVLRAQLSAEYGPDYRPRDRNYNFQQLQKLHFPTKLNVVSGVDTTPPTLQSISIAPDPINSKPGAVQVTVTAHATDTGSGVRFIEVNGGIHHGINGVAAGTYPLADAGIGYLSNDGFHARLKKTANGDWVGVTKVKRCVPSGTYKLSAELADVAGNYHGYSTKELAKTGITSTVDVTSKRGDVAAPYVYSAATLDAESWLILNFSEGVAHVSTSTLTVYPLSPESSRFTTPADVTDVTCYQPGTDTPVSCSGSDGLVTSAVLTIPSLTAGKKYEVYANLNQVTTQLIDGNGNAMGWNYNATEVIGA